MQRYWQNRNFRVGTIIVSVLFFLTFVSLFWTPHNPTKIYDDAILVGPSARFPLGTDYLGRDILSRIMVAGQVSFAIAAGTLVISAIVGITIGLISGYFGGIVDEILMRFIDAWMTIPGTILVIVFIAAFGTGIVQTLLAISLSGFTSFAKMTRSKVLSLKESYNVRWLRSLGVKNGRILFVHILPKIFPTLSVISAMRFSGAIMTEAALSYLGLGVQPPNASWGNILLRAQSYILTNWLYAFFPGFLITMTVIGFNLISDGLNKIHSEAGVR